MTQGQEMYQWACELFPITRSITGPGVRETLHYFKNILPDLKIHEVPTGYNAFDWEVPKEWEIKEAYIENENGQRLIDFDNNNLHVVGYSVPIDKWIPKEELLNYIYTLPEQPDAIPYVTSYYKERWGFCMTHNQKETLKEGKYHVVIKSSLKKGVLNYADLVIPGKTDKEILFSTYICHPSMANNELSGPVLATALANYLTKQKDLRYTYRFVFVPETIGSIVYLSKHINQLKEKVIAGFVLTCVGDERVWSFMPSRKDGTMTDKVSRYVLEDNAIDYKDYSFLQRGSDERQYCSPKVDLPVASIMRSKYGTYLEYHTSDDNLELITPTGLEESFNIYQKVIQVIENNFKPIVSFPCEPQLGKRGLYPDLSIKGGATYVKNMMDILAYSDGTLDLINLFRKTGVDFEEGFKIVNTLMKQGVISKIDI